jgi:hypothetical protein
MHLIIKDILLESDSNASLFAVKEKKRLRMLRSVTNVSKIQKINPRNVTITVVNIID